MATITFRPKNHIEGPEEAPEVSRRRWRCKDRSVWGRGCGYSRGVGPQCGSGSDSIGQGLSGPNFLVSIRYKFRRSVDTRVNLS